MNTSQIIAARHKIARAALNGDTRYDFEPIGANNGDINEMAKETGMARIYRAGHDNDVAVYSDGTRHMLVCDAHGPISISI
jgi:hypothetical protein